MCVCVYILFFITDGFLVGGCSKPASGEGKQEFRPEEKNRIVEQQTILLLAAIGCAVGLGNVWCFCTGPEG